MNRRLSPLSILSIFASVLTAVLASISIPGLGIAFLMVLLSVWWSGCSIGKAIRSYLLLWPLLLTVILMNALFSASDQVLLRFWIFSFSLEGLFNGLRIAIKLMYVSLLSEALNAMFSEEDLRGAIGVIIYPLGFIGVPTGDLAMIITLSLRFIPLLKEECDSIIYAARARGAAFEAKGIISRSRELFPLIIPIFISVFRRADEVALSMEAKGWKSGEKAKWHSPGLKAIDAIVILLSAGLVLLCIFLRIKGVFQ